MGTKETRETKVVKAVMVPIIVSHDGAVHNDTIRRWKDFTPDIKVDWVMMAQNVLRFNVVRVGKFFNKGSWVSEAWRKSTLKNPQTRPVNLLRECLQQRNEESSRILSLVLLALCVCGPRARHLPTAPG